MFGHFSQLFLRFKITSKVHINLMNTTWKNLTLAYAIITFLCVKGI